MKGNNMNNHERSHLLSDSESGGAGPDSSSPAKGSSSSHYGTTRKSHKDRNHEDEHSDSEFLPLQERGWSFQEGRRFLMANGNLPPAAPKSCTHPNSTPTTVPSSSSSLQEKRDARSPSFYLYCVIYALVNVIISAPGLYGYAAVIFNHAIFAKHMNALSKLVIFSSLVHQVGFFLFSSLPFAIGTVQDAGLIFLSSMANTIANRMLDDGHTEQEIMSTTLVLLSVGTAALGIILVLMGHFRLADAVSYLPMPVVGGYLAFIGFFCIQAGLALCISKSITTLGEWKFLLEPGKILLAVPGLLAGLILTLVSRKATNSGVLPLVMVSIPALFYLLIWQSGSSLEDAREQGWVGPVAPSVPVSDLFALVDFRQVRWDLMADIWPTWVGMIFVVSFASCLDVAAISIDMGEALDTNRELKTVGICNFMSGLTCGFTGSYIFSQTIFTYRTGIHTRFIGVLIMGVFFYIVVSPVNMLEISPLFFLGSTLIFIGYDLMWEWLWEVRENIFLSEYFIVWLTFCAIHVVGIDAGIVLGVLIAIVEQIVSTAQTTNAIRVDRRSRAVWTPSDAKMLHDYAYSSIGGARIVTLEMHGTIFFGSSLNLLHAIMDEIGLNPITSVSLERMTTPSLVYKRPPNPSSAVLTTERRSSFLQADHEIAPTTPPRYLVLDLSQVVHLDASATRGTFLQLVKLCAKRGIVVCASGATPRIEWMFRSHGVSFDDLEEETATKAHLLSHIQRTHGRHDDPSSPDKILLFLTVQESLEFCETMLLHRLQKNEDRPSSLSLLDGPEERSLADVLVHLLGSDDAERLVLQSLNSTCYHDELVLQSGDYIFHRRTYPDAFYIVLSGVVANSTSSEAVRGRQERPVLSGAGLVDTKRVGSASNLFDEGFKASNDAHRIALVATLWQVGSVFGYNDYLLDRPRTFGAVATLDGTKVARITHSHMNLAQTGDPALYAVLQKLLLHASTIDLANCTCRDV